MRAKLLISCATAIMAAMTSCTDSYKEVEAPSTASQETIVSQDAMLKGATVVNDQKNVKETGITASIRLAPNTIVKGNTDDPFSVRVSSTEDEGLLTIQCKADGAAFSKPAVLSMEIPGTEGMELVCVSGDEVIPVSTATGNRHTVLLPHFSDWNIEANVTAAADANERCEVTTQYVTCKEGDLYISFFSKSGAVWTGGTKNVTVMNFLKNKVGKYVVTTVRQKRHIEKAGKYTYRINQMYVDKSYTSGKTKFTARVYKGAYLSDFKPYVRNNNGGASN